MEDLGMKTGGPARSKAGINDIARAAFNLTFAAMQPIASEFCRLTKRGVPIDERSKSVEGPATPPSRAFLIWLPIFAINLVYAVRTAMGKALRDPTLRRAGWLTGIAYAGNVLWALQAQFRGLGWASLGIIGTSAAIATAALIEAERSRDVSRHATLAAYSVAPLAGWLTVAAFVNAEGTLTWTKGRRSPEAQTRRAVGLLGGATAVAAATAAASRGNPLFSLAAGWGLGGVAIKNTRNRNREVAAAASIGLAALAGVTFLASRSRRL
jgi:tryptophan-rich sensory protein